MSGRAGGRLPKPSKGDVGLPPEWEDVLRTAYEVGAGRATLDADDDDFVDASRLATPIGDGILWQPSSLDDINDVPSRTLLIFDFIRLGHAARLDPWSWWRIAGKRATAHQYTTDWQARPQLPARCGYDPGEAKLERYALGPCSRCEKLDRGEPEPEATGTVAGVRVGHGRNRDRRGQEP